jgi:hypothetical protein
MTKTEELIVAAQWLFGRHDARHDQVTVSQYIESVLRASPDVQKRVLTRYRDELELDIALRLANGRFGNSIGIEKSEDVSRYLANRIPDFAERFRVNIEDGRFVVRDVGPAATIGVSIRKVSE